MKLRCDRAVPCGSCRAAAAVDSCAYLPTDGALRASDGSVYKLSGSEGSGLSEPRRDAAPAAELQPLDPLLEHAQGFGPVLPMDHLPVPGQPLGADIAADFGGGGLDWLDFDVPGLHIDWDDEHEPLGAAPVDDGEALSVLQPKPDALPWPFEQGHDSQAPRIPLLRLHQLLPKPKPGLRSAAAESLMRLLSSQQPPPSGHGADAGMVAGLELLGELVTSYFAGFQTIQSIVHAPTWDMTDCPAVLLAAMACVGAALSSDADVAQLSGCLGGFCASMITWLVGPLARKPPHGPGKGVR